MGTALYAQKIGDHLEPLTDYDGRIISSYPQRQGIKVTIDKLGDRSLRHLKLYWGGFIPLVAEYWDARKGLVSEYDRQTMDGLLKWVKGNGQEAEALSTIIDMYLEHKSKVVRHKIPDYHKAKPTHEQIHDWLKERAGFYDLVMTPTGVMKRLKSISFEKMKTQEEFNEFYRRVFKAAWDYVFSEVNFDSIEEAEKAAEQLAMVA